MDHKRCSSSIATLVLLFIATIIGATRSAFAENSKPIKNSGSIPKNRLVGPDIRPEEPLEPVFTNGSAESLGFTIIPRDDRDNYMPTGWKILAHQTTSEVADMIDAGYRLVDIYVESFSPIHIFTAVFVENDASYARTWWWYYDIDESTLSDELTDNNARLICLKAYDIGGGEIHFTAIAIRNSGADEIAWWWYYNLSPAETASLAEENEARLTQLNAYQTGGETMYAVVMVDNTGDNYKEWWRGIGGSAGAVSVEIEENNARLVDLDIDPVTGHYNYILTSCETGCPYWWWYLGVTEAQMHEIVSQNGARVIDVNDYPGCGSTCFDIVLINNSNTITTRVGEILRSGTDGTKGLYLEQVGGVVLANLMNSTIFEPASTLKVGVHLHTILQIRDNPAIYHTTLIPRYPPLGPLDSCPDDPVDGTESIFDADRKMMRYSDNATTRELVDFFNQLEGQPDINTTMADIGMTNSSINHVFGCGGPPANETTLDDLAVLYRGVANGTLIDLYDRELFYLQMAGTYQFMQEGEDFSGLVDDAIPLIIDQEAPVGMSTALKDAYMENIFVVYKPGGYDICTDNTCSDLIYYRSLFGYAEIPFCNADGPRPFVFGYFIAEATNKENANDTFKAARAELLREQIRAGLASCFHQNFMPLIVH